jgi:hypothetical protein
MPHRCAEGEVVGRGAGISVIAGKFFGISELMYTEPIYFGFVASLRSSFLTKCCAKVDPGAT